MIGATLTRLVIHLEGPLFFCLLKEQLPGFTICLSSCLHSICVYRYKLYTVYDCIVRCQKPLERAAGF